MDSTVEKTTNDITEEEISQTNDENKNIIFSTIEQIRNRTNFVFWINLTSIIIHFVFATLIGLIIFSYCDTGGIDWNIILPAVIYAFLSVLASCLINWFLINPLLKAHEQEINKTKN